MFKWLRDIVLNQKRIKELEREIALRDGSRALCALLATGDQYKKFIFTDNTGRVVNVNNPKDPINLIGMRMSILERENNHFKNTIRECKRILKDHETDYAENQVFMIERVLEGVYIAEN